MNPLKKFLAILLGSAVVLGATIAFADDSATTDDADEVSVEQTHDDALEVESEDAEAESADAPGQLVPSGAEWDEGYARGLEVAAIAHGDSVPQGFSDRYTTATTGLTTTTVHGKSAEHGADDSEG